MDLAKRAYDHGFRLDPIVRSLLDTDFYKLLMLQMIWREHRDTPVVFQVINRTRSVRLAEEVDLAVLRDQLDHARSLRFTNKELVWLAGNSFYGVKQIFSPDFIAWLGQFQLPEYEVSIQDGQYVLTFSGSWAEVTLWEIPALSILNELRCRTGLRRLGRFELDILYSRAKTRLWSKLERLRELPDLALSDFGTRRRHGFLWQRWCIQALKEGLGSSFIGTSNVLHAMENELEAIGTNGHELPMVLAALARSDQDLAQVPYEVLEAWRRHYDGNLLVVLPDAFGTEAFLEGAPDWVADWTGFRPDSAPPDVAGERLIKWWSAKGRNPAEKLLIFSDGMDVDSIEATHARFRGRA
ncbi:hypothetical protein LTR94_025456, partial [Friedmanniomyces endolithicus]